MKFLRNNYTFLGTFLTFFCLCAFVVTCSFLLFLVGFELPEPQLRRAALATFLNILFISTLFAALDTHRRKKTVDKPVEQIKSALEQITAGDFTVRLDNEGFRDSFSQIMESINRMTEELSGVETLRTDFIANVSHEMKTPLAVMQNYGTLLQQPGLSEEKRMEYARAVVQGSRRLSDLMTNILKLNRLENQQIYPETREYDVGEQLCECLLQFETRWEDANIGIDTDIAEEITVRQDPELLQLVWNNLLSNAFKFTEPGGRVGLKLTADDTYALVTVSDTGCGMTPEVGAHIFEKFYQADTSHATAGNGLGLALVKRIVDITGSEISVRSTPGIGTTFTVRIRR